METLSVYRVDIENKKTGKNFDHYLIKVMPKELPDIEKHIHERYPNNILAVDFQWLR
jgi:hypothetical protein